MLDLVFLVLMVIVLVKANQGIFMETLCKVALVVGIFAGVAGLIAAFFMEGTGAFGLINLAVVFFACLLKPAAKHFVKLYEQKIAQSDEEYRKAIAHYKHDDKPDVYTEDNFDDPELRFGKGGFTDYEPHD